MDHEDLDDDNEEEFYDQNENHEAMRDLEGLWDQAEDKILLENYKVFKNDSNVVSVLK